MTAATTESVSMIVREIMEAMAYLEVATEPAGDAPPGDAILFVDVECGVEHASGFIGLFANKRFARAVAQNFLGATTVDPRLYVDLTKELANVLAGRLLGAMFGGVIPRFIKTPRAVKANEGVEKWREVSPDQRFALSDDGGVLGALVIGFKPV